MLTRDRAKWPKQIPNPPFSSLLQRKSNELILTFVNHSTFLLQTEELTLLTDPIYSERASPVPFAGPRRMRKPGIPFEALPTVDVVLVSHNHYDHMDLPTLRRLEHQHRPAFVTTLGNRQRLVQAGLSRVEELDWWQGLSINSKLTITSTPAEHFSGRTLSDRNRALWGGFFLAFPRLRVLFAADSAYGPHFAMIRERLGRPNLALLPIGAYEPRWFMHNVHMNPNDAVKAHLDLAAARSVGMHFGTFHLSDEAFERPLTDLQASLLSHGVNPETFITLTAGESKPFPLSD